MSHIYDLLIFIWPGIVNQGSRSIRFVQWRHDLVSSTRNHDRFLQWWRVFAHTSAVNCSKDGYSCD